MDLGACDNEFLDRAILIYSIEQFSRYYNLLINRNPRCENNLGEVDKYRYSVALVELGFGTDAVRPAGPV